MRTDRNGQGIISRWLLRQNQLVCCNPEYLAPTPFPQNLSEKQKRFALHQRHCDAGSSVRVGDLFNYWDTLRLWTSCFLVTTEA